MINFNSNYFPSTQIFIQLQLKLFSFNKKISIRLQFKLFLFNKKIFIQLLYLKFPDADIPDVYSTKTARPLPNSLNVWHTDPVSWDALKWRRTGWLKWHLSFLTQRLSFRSTNVVKVQVSSILKKKKSRVTIKNQSRDAGSAVSFSNHLTTELSLKDHGVT